MPDTVDLCFRTGWVLAVPSEVPQLQDLDLVQRFTSKSGWVQAVTIDRDGLNCTCLGWRNRRLCWHIRFVLRWNLSRGEVGRFMLRRPDSDDVAWAARNSWDSWFAGHVALVAPSLAGLGWGAPPY